MTDARGYGEVSENSQSLKVVAASLVHFSLSFLYKSDGCVTNYAEQVDHFKMRINGADGQLNQCECEESD